MYWYVSVCYSYVSRMLVVCIRMYPYVPYVTRMLLVCYPYVLVWCCIVVFFEESVIEKVVVISYIYIKDIIIHVLNENQ